MICFRSAAPPATVPVHLDIPDELPLIASVSFLGGPIREVMFRHGISHAVELEEYVRQPERIALMFDQPSQLGHHLYNELGSLSTALAATSGERTPDILL